MFVIFATNLFFVIFSILVFWDVVGDVVTGRDNEKSYRLGGSGSGSGGFSVISSLDSMIGVESDIFSVMSSSILNSISALILSFRFFTVL